MRFCISSSEFLSQLIPHSKAEIVQLSIRGRWCTLLSKEATTGLPVESINDIECYLQVYRTIGALVVAGNQPILVDLHNTDCSCIYATRLSSSKQEWEQIKLIL